MGFKYNLITAKSPVDMLPHAYLELVAGKGPCAYRYRAADLGSIPIGQKEAHERLEQYREMTSSLNAELATFKTSYSGVREETGMKVYPSIIVSALLDSMVTSFTAFDLMLTDDAVHLLMLLTEDRIFGLDTDYRTIHESLFLPFPDFISDIKAARTELIENMKSIATVLRLYSRHQLGREMLDIAYGGTVSEDELFYADHLLMEKGALSGWDIWNGMPFLSHAPEYGGNTGLESLVHTAAAIVIASMSEKTGLREPLIMKVMKNEGRRIVYDRNVSFSPENPSRNLSRIMKAYNLIPDRYERLEDSMKTMSILIANI